MPLLINLQHLTYHGLNLKGDLEPDELDLDLHDEMIQVKRPLQYDLEVEKMEHALLVQGKLRLTLDCQCVRCLQPFPYDLELTHWAAHLPLEGEDAVPVINDSVDLTPHIREDILLGFPQHPVCKSECGGLKGVPHDKPEKGSAERGLPSDALAELDKLKL